MKDGIDYAEKNGMFFIETSAKTADNINQLFEVLLTPMACFISIAWYCWKNYYFDALHVTLDALHVTLVNYN